MSPPSHRGRGCPHLTLCLSPTDHTDHHRLRGQDAQDLGRKTVGRHLCSDWSVLLRPASGGTSHTSRHICFETLRHDGKVFRFLRRSIILTPFASCTSLSLVKCSHCPLESSTPHYIEFNSCSTMMRSAQCDISGILLSHLDMLRLFILTPTNDGI